MHQDEAETGGRNGAAPLLPGAGETAAPPALVQRRDEDGIATLSFAAPDGNRFGPALVAALAEAVEEVLQETPPEGLAENPPRALVLAARGRDFCAGPHADLPPPGPEPTPLPEVLEGLSVLCRRLADSPVPVVCALQGRVCSAGLALALAAHARLAEPQAVFHFPEPQLGLLPPGGATVRLAWQIGAGPALAFLAAEAPLPAARALELGLIDAILPADAPASGDPGAMAGTALLAAARRVADELAMGAGRGDAAREAMPGLADPAAFRAAILAARRPLPQALPAHRRHEALLIDTVEAAQLLPAEAALDFDLVQAQEAATAPAARALAHLARALRRVADTPEARQAVQPGGRAPVLRREPLVLALTPPDAALLVPPILRSGRRVVMLGADAEALTVALEAVAEAHLDRVAAGLLAQSDADEDWARLEGRLALDGGAPPAAGLASVALAGWLDAVLPSGCPLLVWNPGHAPLTDIVAEARGTEAPGLAAPVQLVAGQVPGPDGLPLLAEIVVPAGLPPEPALLAADLAQVLQATPLRAGLAPMLPVLLQSMRAAAQALFAAGVSPAALAATGLLPAALLSGLAPPAAPPAPPAPLSLPLPPERLLVLALINAGARLLEAGQALRPSDIDVAMVLGAGYPDWRGGPMAEGDGLGLLVLRLELRRAAALDLPGAAVLWTPAPLIDELIRLSWRFEDINRD